MMTNAGTYRLADSTLIEPLINSWAAWWLTLAPVPASLHLLHYQLPLLKAYVQSPDFHARASKDPQLSGGAFVGVPAARAGEVSKLLQRSMSDLKESLRVAEAVEELQGWLLTEARGQALGPFYAKVPEPLRGMVELVYDYNNRPSFRLLEGITYRSPCYRPDFQSLRLSRLGADSARSSFLSTPRILEEGEIDWRVPFRDERLDRLFRLDSEPRPLESIRETLGAEVSEAVLRPLLTDAPLPAVDRWEGSGVRVRYLGHAAVLVEWKGMTILTDPLVGVRPGDGGARRMTYADLPPRIDYALVTHAHSDHYAVETLLRLRHRIRHLVVPHSAGMLVGDVSLKRMSRELGFEDVIELNAFESIPLPDGEITAAPFLGEHGDLAHSKSAYIVRAGQEKFLFAADSACLDETLYRNIRQAFGDIGTVFMNTETEGSPLTFSIEALFPKKRDRKMERDRRCRGSTAAEGMRVLEILGARRLYNYAMGLEPWLEHIIGPASDEGAPRMKESALLLENARSRGLLTAERLQGPKDIIIDG